MLSTTDRGSLQPIYVIFGFVLGLTIAVLLIPSLFLPPKRPGVHSRVGPGELCMINIKYLAMAVEMYCVDFDGKFPPAKTWNDALKLYVKDESTFRCPSIRWRKYPSTYAMNGLLDGLSYDDVAMPEKTVLFFESVPGENLSGGPELFPSRPRTHHGKPHGGRYYPVCFVAGNASMVFEPKVNSLNWRPDYQEEGYIHPSERNRSVTLPSR